MEQVVACLFGQINLAKHTNDVQCLPTICEEGSTYKHHWLNVFLCAGKAGPDLAGRPTHKLGGNQLIKKRGVN